MHKAQLIPEKIQPAITFFSAGPQLEPCHSYWCINWALMKVIDILWKKQQVMFWALALLQSEWRMANTRHVSYCLFHAIYYLPQHSVDTPVCLLLCRRSSDRLHSQSPLWNPVSIAIAKQPQNTISPQFIITPFPQISVWFVSAGRGSIVGWIPPERFTANPSPCHPTVRRHDTSWWWKWPAH